MTDVSAVLFDWGGTLTPWHTVDADAGWLAVARTLPVPDPLAVAGQLAAAETELWLRSRDEHRSATIDEVFAAAGTAPTARALEVYEQHWDPHTYADPDVIPLLTALRDRGLRVGVLSNTIWDRARHERIFDRDGVLGLIDAAVYTSEIPWTKPHPEAFRAAMTAVGVSDPAACVYVGDRLFDDIHGAKQAGMRAVHVPHSAIPAHQVGHTIGEPDAVIERLADLLPLVDGWRA